MDTIKYFCSDILHVTFYVDGEGHLITEHAVQVMFSKLFSLSN